MGKRYKIPVTWQCYGFVEIEAESCEDALIKAIKKENSEDSFVLPADGNYVENTFRFNTDLILIEALNEEE